MTEVSKREILKIMRRNGYYIDRVNGSHHIFKNDSRQDSLSISFNQGKNNGCNGVIWKRLKKEHDII